MIPFRLRVPTAMLFMTLSAAGGVADVGGAGPYPSDADSGIDRLHSSVESLFDETVNRIDSFFVTDSYDTFVEPRNRLRFRVDLDRLEHLDWEASGRVKLNMRLRRLNERLRLVVNDGEEGDEDEAIEIGEEEDYIAARYVAQRGRKTGLSVDGGVRLKSGKLDAFGRINGRIRYALGSRWQGQSTNRLYYYSRSGWRNDFRQYFDRLAGEAALLRLRTRVQYFEDRKSNPRIEQKVSLFRPIDDRSAIVYEALWRRQSAEDSPFDDGGITVPEQDHYDHVALRLRYRSSFWRPWLFFEAWPGVGWVEERDWDRVFGIRLRLEVNFGRHVGPRLDE